MAARTGDTAPSPRDESHFLQRKKMQKSAAAILLGSNGGKASAAKLTPEQRQERARKAVAARWAHVRAMREADHKAESSHEWTPSKRGQ